VQRHGYAENEPNENHNSQRRAGDPDRGHV
jgi:hypothetical protein